MTTIKKDLVRFEKYALPHLDAAFNLARWLVGNDGDAQDVVQEAYLRALKYFDSFHGVDARGWLLTIVRNTSYNWLRQYRNDELTVSMEDEKYYPQHVNHEQFNDISGFSSSVCTPEAQLIQQADDDLLRRTIAQLPVEYREVTVLRELEEMTYKQIAAITGVPVGTVMSRLARARKRLQQLLTPEVAEIVCEEFPNEL